MPHNSFEKIEIPLKKLIGGASYHLVAYKIIGTSVGPHVHIQSSVHGAEVQGSAVIFRLMQYFIKNEFAGSITFIPHANPIASNCKEGTYTQGRFNPATGTNWNRIYTDISKDPLFMPADGLDAKQFKKSLTKTISKIIERDSSSGISIEKKLGLLLQKMAASADIVLDLHTGPSATRYLYVGDYAINKAQDLPFPYKIIIPNEFAGAMDEATFMPWIIARASLNIQEASSIPFESYTVELGSEEQIDLDEAYKDKDMILHLLASRGVLKKSPLAKTNKSICAKLEHYKSYYAPFAGLIQYLKEPGQKVAKDEPLYQILNFSNLDCPETLGWW